MKIKFEWEQIGIYENDQRAKVIGGWLVTTNNNRQNIVIVFVPDPKHKWEIE